MVDVTQLLSEIGKGNAQATDRLLPIVYEELRRLAAQKLGHEKPGHTLQATALVHEAYMRLVGASPDDRTSPGWDSRGHFFSAAAEAMRRILIDSARRKKRLKHGGDRERMEMDVVEPVAAERSIDLIALDEALEKLAAEDAKKAKFVSLRFFAGLTVEQAADAMGMSRATANRMWKYSRAWLFNELKSQAE